MFLVNPTTQDAGSAPDGDAGSDGDDVALRWLQREPDAVPEAPHLHPQCLLGVLCPICNSLHASPLARGQLEGGGRVRCACFGERLVGCKWRWRAWPARPLAGQHEYVQEPVLQRVLRNVKLGVLAECGSAVHLVPGASVQAAGWLDTW